jgi:hypothetical protein
MTTPHLPEPGSTPPVWTVAIFTAREQAGELLTTINSIIEASREPTVIDIMVNGNPELASGITELIRKIPISGSTPLLRVWSIPLAGKAHAWNQYVHLVWPGQKGPAFFVDGYARVDSDGLQLLAAALSKPTELLAAGGVPVSGRTATRLRESTLREGGLHGAFFALKSGVMNEFRDRDFCLPLGLYGFDSLLGAVLAFGIDPSRNQWDVKRFIFLHPDVGFTIDQKKWWRYSVVKTQIRRILNNALRVLVVEATKNFLAQRKRPPEDLPRTVEDFVLSWVRDYPNEARKTLWRSPLCRLALKKLRQPRDWSAAQHLPMLIHSSRQG